MNGIKQIFCGESIRRSLEGATTQQITQIANAPSPITTSSPFAKVLGYHLAAEKIEQRTKRKSKKKGKKRKG